MVTWKTESAWVDGMGASQAVHPSRSEESHNAKKTVHYQSHNTKHTTHGEGMMPGDEAAGKIQFLYIVRSNDQNLHLSA